MTSFLSGGRVPGGRLSGAPVRRVVLVLVGLALAAAGVDYGLQWWLVGRFIESTNDAYLHSDQVVVAPKVSGYVSAVLVGDNEAVAEGQILARIDAKDYQATLNRQRATSDARQADIAVAKAQIAQAHASAAQARAKLAGSVVAARFAANQESRYRKLAASGAETAERLAQMVNDREQAEVTVTADQAALDAAERNAETVAAQLGQAIAQAEAAQASVHSAVLDVDNTVVRAPIAGRVGDRAVRVGGFVQPGTRLMSIVPVAQIYVVANFKETQLAQMRRGQKVRVEIDALGGRPVAGEVDSFAPGTGAEFALLPPENATGNFTKIVQRVPVRIRLAMDPALQDRLLPGLSATVSVDTRSVRETEPRP